MVPGNIELHDHRICGGVAVFQGDVGNDEVIGERKRGGAYDKKRKH